MDFKNFFRFVTSPAAAARTALILMVARASDDNIFPFVLERVARANGERTELDLRTLSPKRRLSEEK